MTDGRRRFCRIAAVLTIAGFPVVSSLFNLATPFIPYGKFGFAAAGNGTITHVRPFSAAAEAGLKPADRFDVPALSPEQRVYVHWSLTLAGRKAEFALRKGPAPTVTLVARRSHASAFEIALYFAIFDLFALSLIAIVLIAAALVLAHPSRMTWAFLFYAAGSIAGSPILTALVSPPCVVAYSACCGILWFGASVALVVFALRFPGDRVAGAGAIADRCLPWIAVVAAPIIVAANVSLVYRGTDTDGFEHFLTIASTVLYCLAVIVFGFRYFTEGRDERPRIAWVIASFLVGYAGIVVVRICDSLNISVPDNVVNLLLSLIVVVPIAVAYAIGRQRVISVRFFVNKAFIFAVLAGLTIGAIILLDWFIAWRLERTFSNGGTPAVVAVNVAAALALGFLMSWLYPAIRDFIDRHIFTQRYRARQHMQELAKDFANINSPQMIDEALVGNVSGSLGIDSVAVFVRDEDGTFRREAARGWGDDDGLDRLDIERLAAAFERARGAVRFADPRLISRRVPAGDAAPALGFPIFVRGELSSFVLFSGHPHGLDLDPTETHLIDEVTRAASHGFARLSQL
ncbi:MAG: hypothetical protein WAL67_04410 [Candidatus Cybelea sp.]